MRAARSGAACALAGLLAAAGFALTTGPQRVEGLLFDGQVRALRALTDPDAARFDPDVVLVGLDEATLAAVPEPIALLHESLGSALTAIAGAAPAFVAIDVVLPERSYDALVPGLDAALIRGLVAARRAGGLVFVLSPGPDGRLRAPYEPFVAAAGHTHERPALATALYPRDVDHVVRRYDPALAAGPVPTLVAAVAGALGRGERVHAGYVDYTRGARFGYVPLIEVMRWQRADRVDELRRNFAGKVVLIGSVLPDVDTHPQPVALIGWPYPNAHPPGMLVHAQALRSVFGAGLIAPLPWFAPALLAVLLAALALVPGTATRAGLLLAFGAGSCALGAWLHASGQWLPLAAPWFAGGVAVVARTGVDIAAGRRERRRLTATFGGYVSPQVLQAILAGGVGARGGRRHLAFMFVDLADFTRWSERASPDEVLAVLNRYYAAVTPLIHREGGTIDNFRGDGLMVMFGAPQPHARPCDAALASAAAVLAAVAALNRDELGACGVPLEVSIGIAYGDAVFGDLGSPERKDFTALGDAVNVAARVQALARSLGYPVVLTRAAVEQLAAAPAGLDPIGPTALKGHTPVELVGWRPPPAAGA